MVENVTVGGGGGVRVVEKVGWTVDGGGGVKVVENVTIAGTSVVEIVVDKVVVGVVVV